MDETQAAPDHAAAILAYRETLRDFWTFVHKMPIEEFSTATELPGWTVQDIISHVIGIESDLLGRTALVHTPNFAALPHVADPFAQYIEVSVDARRGTEPAAVRDELDEVIDDRILLLSTGQLDIPGPAKAFFGSVERMLVMRPFDIWVHEQDLRRATDRPGNFVGAGAQVTSAAIRSMLPRVVGKAVKPPAGTSVRWVVTGGVPFTATIVMGDDGRAAESADFVGEPTATLHADWLAFAHISAGRKPDTEPQISGDRELAADVLAGSVVTP